MRVPLGVIGIIYESRPNVTADAAALCLKAGQRLHPARRIGVGALELGDRGLHARGAASREIAGNAVQVIGPRTARRSASSSR